MATDVAETGISFRPFAAIGAIGYFVFSSNSCVRIAARPAPAFVRTRVYRPTKWRCTGDTSSVRRYSARYDWNDADGDAAAYAAAQDSWL